MLTSKTTIESIKMATFLVFCLNEIGVNQQTIRARRIKNAIRVKTKATITQVLHLKISKAKHVSELNQILK